LRTDIINILKKTTENIVFYTKNYDKTPIYSYIELNSDSTIINIREKEKISDNANTGAYAFSDINVLYEYCKCVIDNNINFNNEPYTSCVISEMIKTNITFKGYEINEKTIFSLGTPDAVEYYMDNTYAFLFDLDGTLVITDDIYFDVWYEMLSKYNILLTKDIFKQYIQGNNDKYVLKSLLMNIQISLEELSEQKDELFIKNINKLKIIDGVYDIINQIKTSGHKMCIVTNCNKRVANEIVKYIHIENSIDFIISSNDCINGKPNSEPYKKAIERYKIANDKCFIFEDSKSGLLSAKGVNPKLLIGIETIYNKNEILNYGVNYSIKNYSNISIDELINSTENQIDIFKNILFNNSCIIDITNVVVDDNKLKGGFIADVISFQIITSDGKIFSQVVKYENTQENNLSSMAKQLELYDREYYFYTKITDKITNIKIPKFYNLIKNEENKNCGIVLENLLEKNYKINLNLNIESIDVTLKIIDRMAKLHSTFWNKDLKFMFSDLKSSVDEIFCPFFTNFINEKYEKFQYKWFKILNETQKQNCEYIFNNFSSIQKRFSSGNNLTFIHGDIKSPNIFYDIENDNEPYFIDWQHCAIGKGVQDLVFFIIESFDIINIKSVFELCKNYYYKKLLENGICDYSIEEYEKDIYDAICYIPFFTGIWFGTIDQDELIDKNFPYFLITKMFYLIDIIYKK